MHTRTSAILVSATMVFAAGAARPMASNPVGVYAVVEKVVFEPAEGAPQRVQVWGAFAVADTRNNDDYTSPQKGYLYYSCPSNQDRTCANEWADLKSVAGKEAGVGFGGRFVAAGRIRKAAEPPSAPDVYPIRMGVVRMTGVRDQGSIVGKLKAALAER